MPIHPTELPHIVRQTLKSPDDLDSLRQVMMDFYCFETRGAKRRRRAKFLGGSKDGSPSKQNPEELFDFLCFLSKNSHRIETYCEIGTYKGGSFFIIDSYLRYVNPQLKSIAMDLRLNGRIIEYAKVHPVELIKANSHHYSPKEHIDLCFIDGDHSYEGVKADFEVFSPYSKIIALHDISHKRYSVRGFWSEALDKYPPNCLTEINNSLPTYEAGIGIIDLEHPQAPKV